MRLHGELLREERDVFKKKLPEGEGKKEKMSKNTFKIFDFSSLGNFAVLAASLAKLKAVSLCNKTARL